MKQWQQDQENPEGIAKRNKKLAEQTPKPKQNKKMSVAALAHWHNITDYNKILR
jgi:hypothetical protein